MTLPFDIGYLFGPAAFSLDYPTMLRVYTHEVLHFWQTLSMGFITNLALNEWLALSEYEQTGNPSRQSDLLQAFTTRDPDLGFSASDLSEALCRFWDIHILNPEDLLKEQNQPEDYYLMIDQSLVERGKELLQQLPDNHPLRRYPSHVVARIIDGSSQPYSGRDFDRLIAEFMNVKDVYAAPYSMALE
jgi:hypothetical protein